jgi:tetratricopeptide (TPR) repeat protein
MKTHNLLVIIFLFAVSQLIAQPALEKLAIQAESGAYEMSIQGYKDYLTLHPKEYKVCLELANILKATGKYTEAEIYFQMIPMEADVYQKAGEQYAQMLKKMGRYKEIPGLMVDYIQKYPEQGKVMLKGLETVNDIYNQSPKYDLLSMPSNSSASDFGLTFYHDMPIFSSFREDVLMDQIQSEFNRDGSGQKTIKYDGSKNRLDYITGINNKIYKIGPISYAKTVNKCAYIEGRLTSNLNMERDFKNASVHIAEVNTNGDMSSSKPFLYNEMGSSINSIFLSPDGRSLYFASDRSGGYGGFDLYVSHLEKGTWSIPVNLGPEINTAYNEITPFIHDNKIYYASDNLQGLGGYDIYNATFENGKWSGVTMMDREINSPEDDYFPAFNNQGDMFFTSNRLGGIGKNDIYKVIKTDANLMDELVTEVPQAVSLEALTMETQKHTSKETDVHKVSYQNNEKRSTAFILPEFVPEKVGKPMDSDEFWQDAHRIALDELVPNTEVFFIQLASMTAVKPNYIKYKPLLRYGNIYRMVSNNTVKIRLGYYSDRKEAEDVLAKIKAIGFNDAFITFEVLNTAQMELMLTSKDDKNFSDAGNFNTGNKNVAEEYRAANKYKVRLASYEDPIWFDVNKVKDLGRIEQWTKGGWTIFILAGYGSFDEAKRVQIQAVNRGYKTAEVVVDNDGILERIKQN